MLAYSPAMQTSCFANKDDSYFGNYPTLAELNDTYGEKAAQVWLIPQLTDLSEFCGARDKFTENQLRQCSEIIATDYKKRKVSEMMLFFSYFKRGHFGRFYGAIDPLVILDALTQFCNDCGVVYKRHEQQIQNEQREAQKEGTCSWEEYAEMAGLKDKTSPLERIRAYINSKQERKRK